MTTFYTSDTHFGHIRIIELCNRPYSSVTEMNEDLIERWNRVVKPTDIVYHMGDVALGKISSSLPLVRRLNGKKILVPGNHDRVFSSPEMAKQRERFIPEYRKVFDIIYPETVVTRVRGHMVVMSHFPYHGDSHGEDRYVSKRPVDEGFPLIHGHIHEKRRIEGSMFNVGVDVNDFTPVHEDVIYEWIENLKG